MIERVLQLVAPHPCFGCGKVGSSLCAECKYDIIYDPFIGCIKCGLPQKNGICADHKLPIERVYVAGARTTALQSAIDSLKFSNNKAAAKDLAELIHLYLPILPSNICIVPVPTSPVHIRQRGYDQVLLIARHFAALRNIPIATVLNRHGSKVQHQSSKRERERQAAQNYSLQSGVSYNSSLTYLLIDDIITTGSTVEAAAQQLIKTGAKVWVTALAYQPLD